MKALNMMDNWGEYLSFLLLIAGFILAFYSTSAIISYFVIFFCGMAAGRTWFRVKTNLRTPIFLIIVGFLIGFVLGVKHGDKQIIIILFLIGIIVASYIHEKGFIKTAEL